MPPRNICSTLMVSIAIAFAASAAASASAIETTSPSKAAADAVIKLAPLIKVVGWFKGPGNLIGVASRVNGEPLIFFTDPEGRYMVTGAAIEIGSGKNLLVDATAHFFSRDIANGKGIAALPAPSKSAADRKTLGNLYGISQGKGASGKVAYVVIDFGCEHCMRMYQALSKEKIEGEIRWIPVTFSGEVATTKAALAIGSGTIDPVMGLAGKDLANAIAVQKEFLGKGAMAAESNTKFISGLKVKSTPHFYYETEGVMMEHSGYASVTGLVDFLGVR